jgi:hypothetical protein
LNTIYNKISSISISGLITASPDQNTFPLKFIFS